MKNVKTVAFALGISCAAITYSLPAKAETALVAVAANFTAAAKDMAVQFEQKTGHKVTLSFGSTGKIYSRIEKGAPYDVFLAADQKRPIKAEKEGLAVSGSRITYALGKLVLWGPLPGLDKYGAEILKAGKFSKLSITNPKTAPYGAAAVAHMKKLGVYDAIESKLVEGASLTQTLQFITTGNAQMGYLAKSQTLKLKDGSTWEIPASDYPELQQDAVLLKHGADNPAAKEFLKYLSSDSAKSILETYGYGWK